MPHWRKDDTHMTFDLPKIAAVTGGRLHPQGAQAAVSGVSTDSRTVVPGNLFVALKGPNFDGHVFLATAAQQGAVAALCERYVAEVAMPQIVVSDTLRALGDLAAAWRAGFDLPVAAITGSSGKTTTKEMLSTILGTTAPGLKTAGNFNNLIGLPLTIFQLSGEHRWAVLEMGMSERGEIARLTEIAAPTVGIVTNVAPAHLATLKSLDGVARAKGELFAALQAGKTAVINSDDERVAAMPIANGVRRVLYGCHPKADIRAEQIYPTGGAVTFLLRTPAGSHNVCLPLPGRHNVTNALAAAAAAFALGWTLDAIVAGLETFRTVQGRMDVVALRDGITLVEDTYNANPLSMRAALLALDEMGGAGCRVAVLGDMLELGETSALLHYEVGQFAALHSDLLITLGTGAEQIAAGARKAGMITEQVLVAPDHETAVQLLEKRLRPGDRIVVKGSRGMKMERVTAALRERFARIPERG